MLIFVNLSIASPLVEGWPAIWKHRFPETDFFSIQPWNGELTAEVSLVHLPQNDGMSLDVVWRFGMNHATSARGWFLSSGVFLEKDSSDPFDYPRYHYPIFVDPKGHEHVLFPVGDHYLSADRYWASLKKVNNGFQGEVRSPDGVSYRIAPMNQTFSPLVVISSLHGQVRWEYQYDSTGHLESIQDKKGHVFNFHYNAEGQLKEFSDLLHRVFSFEYRDGRFVELQAPGGQAWVFQYLPHTTLLTDITTPRGLHFHYQYRCHEAGKDAQFRGDRLSSCFIQEIFRDGVGLPKMHWHYRYERGAWHDHFDKNWGRSNFGTKTWVESDDHIWEFTFNGESNPAYFLGFYRGRTLAWVLYPTPTWRSPLIQQLRLLDRNQKTWLSIENTWEGQRFSDAPVGYRHHRMAASNWQNVDGVYRPLLKNQRICIEQDCYQKHWKSFDKWGFARMREEIDPKGRSRIFEMQYHHQCMPWWIGHWKSIALKGVGILRSREFKNALVSKWDAEKKHLSYHYDENQYLLETRDRSNHSTRYRHWEYGHPSIAEDELGVLKQEQYDAMGRLIFLKKPSGQWEYRYNDRDEITQVLKNNQVQKICRDLGLSQRGWGRECHSGESLFREWKNALGSVLESESVLGGEQISHIQNDYYQSGECMERHENGNVTKNRYDLLGRLLERKVCIHQGQNCQSIHWNYQGSHKIQVQRGDYHISYDWQRFDPFLKGEINHIKDNRGLSVAFTYDLLGHVKAVDHPFYHVKYQYDLEGYLHEKEDSYTHHTHWYYAENGWREKLKNALGTVTYQRDMRGRITGVHYSDETADVHIHYDEQSRIQKFCQGLVCTSYEYKNDAIQSMEQVIGSHVLKAIWERNEHGHLIKLHYPDGWVVDFSPDLKGLPRQINREVSDLSYDERQQLKRLSVGNAHIDYCHDAWGHLIDIDWRDKHWSWQYDEQGLLSRYDNPLHHWLLTHEKQRILSAENEQGGRWTYQYDSLGARLNPTVEHDPLGRVVTLKDVRFQYGLDNDLKEISDPSHHLFFLSNGNHQRVMMDDDHSRTYWFYDPDGKLLCMETPKLWVDFVYVQGKLQLIRRVSKSTQKESWEWIIDDQQGTPLASIDMLHGKLVHQWEYTPFGETLGEKPMVLGFHGKVYEPISQTYDFGARVYHPGRGEFLSVDPLRAELQIHNLYPYQFAWNEPNLYSDIAGLYSWPEFRNDASWYFSTGWDSVMSDDLGSIFHRSFEAMGPEFFEIEWVSYRISEWIIECQHFSRVLSGILQGIQTPFDMAKQSLHFKALLARYSVVNGGALYRLGRLGHSVADAPQYWSREWPLSTGYIAKHALLGEQFDFIEIGHLKYGASFITRNISPLGQQPGGGLEVVVAPGDVSLQYFHMLSERKF